MGNYASLVPDDARARRLTRTGTVGTTSTRMQRSLARGGPFGNDDLAQLSQLAGNAAASSLMAGRQDAAEADEQPSTMVEKQHSTATYALSVSIPRVSEPVAPAPLVESASGGRADSGPEEQADPTELLQEPADPQLAGVATGTESGSEQGESPPIPLPDVVAEGLDQIGRCDTFGAFPYSGSITKGGATPSGFGVTRSFNASLKNVFVVPVSGHFVVTAMVDHPITYQIRSGTGPAGQVDINGATSGNITKANQPTVVSDLTPDMSDLNGRPPRTAFWAEDLTEKHEKVHADDDKGNAPGVVSQFRTWLQGQPAASVADVQLLLGQFPARFSAGLLAALSTVDGEKHAYGDGAPSYQIRASLISAAGALGLYP